MFLLGSEELAKKLVEKGSIQSEKIETVFAKVSRAVFVPPELEEKAFEDRPIRQGMFHLSAPHMYAIVLEALDVQSGQYYVVHCYLYAADVLSFWCYSAHCTVFEIARIQ